MNQNQKEEKLMEQEIMNEQLPMDEINYEPKSQSVHRFWLMPKYLYKLVRRLTPKFVREAEWDPFFLWVIMTTMLFRNMLCFLRLCSLNRSGKMQSKLCDQERCMK